MVPVRLVVAAVLWTAAGLAAQSPAPTAPTLPASVPLPDQDAFFAEVRKRLASNDLIQSRYSFRERSTELHLNPFGRNLGTDGVQVFEVYPHPDEALTYRRLVEDDGRALSRDELAEQDRKYRGKLAAWQRRLSQEDASGRAVRIRRAEEAKQRDAALAREALDLFDFRITGRSTWEKEPAILIAFTPRDGVSPRSREGRVARAFAGQAWVHEHEYEVMNVEATAIEDVSFGWGVIAKLYKGSTARFTRRRINGAWLPVESRFTGTGRAVIFRRLQIDFARDYYDYRPFDISELAARLGWEP
jgi:hypothetical protein